MGDKLDRRRIDKSAEKNLTNRVISIWLTEDENRENVNIKENPVLLIVKFWGYCFLLSFSFLLLISFILLRQCFSNSPSLFLFTFHPIFDLPYISPRNNSSSTSTCLIFPILFYFFHLCSTKFTRSCAVCIILRLFFLFILDPVMHVHTSLVHRSSTAVREKFPSRDDNKNRRLCAFADRTLRNGQQWSRNGRKSKRCHSRLVNDPNRTTTDLISILAKRTRRNYRRRVCMYVCISMCICIRMYTCIGYYIVYV